jgi:hypothetical protein
VNIDYKQLALVLAVAVLASLAAVYAPSPIREAAGGVAVLAVGALRSFFNGPPSLPPAGPAVLALCLSVAGLGGCKLLTPANVDTALKVADVACIMASQLTDVKEVALACNVVMSPEMEAILKKLVATRDAARKSGVAPFDHAADAGAEAGK